MLKYTFAQRRNRLTTHFPECIPVVKRRISVLGLLSYEIRKLELECIYCLTQLSGGYIYIYIYIITNTMHTIGVDKITLFKTTQNNVLSPTCFDPHWISSGRSIPY